MLDPWFSCDVLNTICSLLNWCSHHGEEEIMLGPGFSKDVLGNIGSLLN